MLRCCARRRDGERARLRWRHQLALQTPRHNETIDVFYIKMQLKFYILCSYNTFNCVFCDNYGNLIISAIIQHYLIPVTYTVHVSSKMCMDATDSKFWVPCALSISLFFIYSNSVCKTMWPWTLVEPCARISWDRQSMILNFTKI